MHGESDCKRAVGSHRASTEGRWEPELFASKMQTSKLYRGHGWHTIWLELQIDIKAATISRWDISPETAHRILMQAAWSDGSRNGKSAKYYIMNSLRDMHSNVADASAERSSSLLSTRGTHRSKSSWAQECALPMLLSSQVHTCYQSNSWVSRGVAASSAVDPYDAREGAGSQLPTQVKSTRGPALWHSKLYMLAHDARVTTFC